MNWSLCDSMMSNSGKGANNIILARIAESGIGKGLVKARLRLIQIPGEPVWESLGCYWQVKEINGLACHPHMVLSKLHHILIQPFQSYFCTA